MLDARISRRDFVAGAGAVAVAALASSRAGATPNWGPLDKILADSVACQ